MSVLSYVFIRDILHYNQAGLALDVLPFFHAHSCVDLFLSPFTETVRKREKLKYLSSDPGMGPLLKTWSRRDTQEDPYVTDESPNKKGSR